MPSKGVSTQTPKKQTATATSKTPAAKKGKTTNWYFPVASSRITQTFSGSHHAIDIGVPVGTPLYAPRAGVIEKVAFDTGGYGEHIVLDTIDGLRIYLGHLSEVNVKPGQEVLPGQQIGKTGNTGRSTGPHLHYEIRQGSGRIDPLSLAYGQARASATKTSTPTAASVTRSNIITKPGLIYQKAPTVRTAPGTPAAGAIQPGAVLPAVSKSVKASGTAQPYAAETPNPRPPVVEVGKEGVKVNWGNIAVPFTKEGTIKDLPPTAAGLFDKINWVNVIAGLIGLVLVSIGVFGIVSSEAIKQAAAPIVDTLKKTAG